MEVRRGQNVNSELGWRYTTISDLMINEQIRDREVRLVGEKGEQLGIMSARDAYLKAQEAGLDLVKIAPRAKPPVCKIIDYGKYRYEMSRKEKEARKKQKTVEITRQKSTFQEKYLLILHKIRNFAHDFCGTAFSQTIRTQTYIN